MLNRVGRKLKLTGLICGIALVAVAWQNCSKIQLEQVPINMLSLSPSMNLKGTVCPQSITTDPSPTAFLFVLDMSTSNIGAPLIEGIYQYWDKNRATDLDGARFDAIKYFLDNCGAANAKFAVIGFSEGVGSVVGSGSRANWSSNCNNITFGTAAAATSVIEGFRAEQAAESTWYNQWSKATNNYLTTTAFPPIMKGTNYIDALKCANQIINKDLISPASAATEQYQVIFITDGTPNDPMCAKTGMTPAQREACYDKEINLQISDMRQSALSLAKDLRLSTVFYGSAFDAGAGGLPRILEVMSNDGGTPAPMQLATFKDNHDALCSLVNSQLSIAFQPDAFFTVNLTTINKGGKQTPDSDMDGIPDDEEGPLGYDPHNARSMVPGVLDGICQRLGGLSQCQTKRDAIFCDGNKFTNYLSECDIKILDLDKVTQHPTKGLDSDSDTVPDFIEIIKGTDPLFRDSLLDTDGDGVTNQKEILQGSDPAKSDRDFMKELMNIFAVKFNPQAQACTHGGWEIASPQTSVSQTAHISSFPAELDELNHAGTDQVLWMGFRLVPKNSANEQVSFYGKTIKVHLTKGGLEQTANPGVILDPDFVNMGQVMP